MTIAVYIPAPRPETVDTLIGEYQRLEKLADEAEAARLEAEKNLVAIVKLHGQRPETAAQSILLKGIHNEALVTLPVTRSLDEKAITKLLDYMKAQKLIAYFEKMFASSTKYTLIDGAQDALRGLDIPTVTRNKVLQYFGMCIVVKDSKPKLKVKAVKPEKPAKKARGGKVAA